MITVPPTAVGRFRLVDAWQHLGGNVAGSSGALRFSKRNSPGRVIPAEARRRIVLGFKRRPMLLTQFPFQQRVPPMRCYRISDCNLKLVRYAHC